MNADKKTILVVDDVPENIAILEEILEQEYRVKAATGGEAALKIARADPPPDLIILDIMMPDMDGFEVCRNLREEGAGASIPVIFLTSKNAAADESMGFEVGAVDYLTKPVNPDTVKTRVKAHLEQKETAIRLSEIRYRRLFETAKDGILILDAETGSIIDVNPSLIAMLGFSQEAFLGAKIWELGSLKDIAGDKDMLLHLQRREYVRYKRVPLETRDGRRIDVEYFSSAYLVNHRSVIQFNMRDITEQVAAERQRQELSDRLHHYIATSPTITYSLRIERGRTVWQWVSENVARILGYSPAEVLEPHWWSSRVHPEDRKNVISAMAELISKDVLTREYRFTTKDRRSIWLRDEMRLLHASADGSDEVVGSLTDITESKRAQRKLEALLDEKDVLLREVHHRVKNNMQVVSSLLNLSEDGLCDAASRSAVGGLRRRIGAMAIVHEQFYDAPDLSNIDFSLYLSRLVDYILGQTGTIQRNPEIRYSLVPLVLDLESAIPAGLIVSELVSNAVKFSDAGPDGKGIICISLKVRNRTEMELEISDNGPGFPEGFVANNATSLGMQLVEILSQQLSGTVSLRNDQGAVVSLRFINKYVTGKGLQLVRG